MLKDENLILRVKKVYSRAINGRVSVDRIPNKNLVNELEIDSILALEILIMIEQEFDIFFEDDDLNSGLVDQISNLTKHINAKIGA